MVPSRLRPCPQQHLPRGKSERLPRKPGCSPRFVYGILMLPTVLKYYLDAKQTSDIDKSMTQASLFGYKLYQFSESSPPVICKSSDPQATVEGILIFDLDEH